MDHSFVTGTRTAVTKEHFETVRDYLLPKLKAELPAYLTYHNAAHTAGVLKAAEYLMHKEGVPLQEKWLVLTAALFHDTGFLKHYENHEEASCNIAWETLPSFGYSNESIEAICRLIMVTRLPQEPTNLYEEILCDADLFYLGRAEFSITSENLFKEWKAAGLVQSDEEWKAKQLRFLAQHQYFTGTARAELEPGKKAQARKMHEKSWLVRKSSYFHSDAAESLKDVFWMIAGVFIAGFALKSIMVPHQFLDGGITGISLLLHELKHYNLTATIILANLPMIAVSYFSVSKRFAVKTMACVVLLGLCLMIPYPAVPVGERILLAVFGGFFLGVGIGFCMRGGCALDGVEVLALKTFKRTPFTVTEVILAINVLIFCVAAFHPRLGILTAFYSVVTYFTASKTIDYVIEGIEAYTGVTIISSESEMVKYRLVNEMGKGITVYKGERGYLPGHFETSTDCDIIFTVVTRLELRRLKNLVYETDPKAFVFASTIREATGGILRRKQEH